MLAQGLDLSYRAALESSAEHVTRVEVWRGNTLLEKDLDFIDGSVTAALTSRVTRNLQLIVDEDLYPESDDDLLAPWGNEIRVKRGIRLGDGREILFTIFRGKIEEDDGDDGSTDIVASDRAADVVDAKFTRPVNSSVGVPVVEEIKRLISDALPDAEFAPSDSFYQTMPLLIWEEDRAGALDEIATAVGSFWYALADGKFVVRRVPWTTSGEPVITLSDADIDRSFDYSESKIILSARPKKSRAKVFNSISVISERTDGTPPVLGFAEDTRPESPTYVYGPFGRRHMTVSLKTPTSSYAATGAAQAYLKRMIALGETWTWRQVPDASLELGDVVKLNTHKRRRGQAIQVVTGFTIPLHPAGIMTVSGTSQVISNISEEDFDVI